MKIIMKTYNYKGTNYLKDTFGLYLFGKRWKGSDWIKDNYEAKLDIYFLDLPGREIEHNFIEGQNENIN